MKIERNVEAERVSAVQAAREAGAASESDAPASSAPVPLLNLSNEGKTVQKLRERVDQSPNVRAEKVAQLKTQVEQGTLSIDTQKLADLMERVLGHE